VLQKIRRDEVRGMIVLPVWPSADWWPLFESMRERFQIADTLVFLNDSGDVRPCRGGRRVSPSLMGRSERGTLRRQRLHLGKVQRSEDAEAMEGHEEAEDQFRGKCGTRRGEGSQDPFFNACFSPNSLR